MKYLRSTIFVVCLLLPFLGFAQESSNIKNENDVDQLLELVSIKQTLSELPKELKSQFSQNPFGISSTKNQELIKLFNEAYNADSLLKTAHISFEESFNSNHSNSVLTSLRSDTIKPILASKADFYTVQGIRKQIVTKYELEQNEPSQERINIIKDLIKHSSAKNSEIESQTILFRSLVIATNKMSSKLSLSETQINSVVSNFKSRMQMQLEDELINDFMVMYHGIKDDRLRTYADFYATEEGTVFKNSLNSAVHTAFEAASDRFISSVETL